MIEFHLEGYRHLKYFYTQYVQKHLQSEFPETVSYNRFGELQQKLLLPMVLFLKVMQMGSCTGISFVDSTPLRVCHNAVIPSKNNNNRPFEHFWRKPQNDRTLAGWLGYCGDSLAIQPGRGAKFRLKSLEAVVAKQLAVNSRNLKNVLIYLEEQHRIVIFKMTFF